MRPILYIVILLCLLKAPVQKLDVAELEPVQTVSVRCEQNKIILETDTQNRGEGETLKEAISDLEKRTPGVIYLDTAQYLLLTKDAIPYIRGLEKYLRSSVRACLWDGKGSVEMADKYLCVRNDLPTLKSLISNAKINFEKS